MRLNRKAREFVLFEAWSDGWNKNMPVSMFIYSDGMMDLHCQTGDHHRQAIAYAREMLYNMDLLVNDADFCGGTGMYYKITPRWELMEG